MNDQPDLFGARELKREALDRVASNAGPWFPRALAVIAGLDAGWSGTGEDLRLLITRMLGPPHHCNVWGSLTERALKRGYLHPIGKRVPMRTARSKARQTDVYRRG